jgi:hypothetical protein
MAGPSAGFSGGGSRIPIMTIDLDHDNEEMSQMRTLLKVGMDTEAANEAIARGTLAEIIQSAMDRLHPEAAYFAAENGRRTAFIVFDLKEPSDLPVVAEPFFTGLKATVDVSPVMNIDDVADGLQKADAARGR